jgi:hypothetical protein
MDAPTPEDMRRLKGLAEGCPRARNNLSDAVANNARKLVNAERPKACEGWRDLVPPDFAAPDSKPRRPRIMVAGKGRHGKDTVCDFMRQMFGMTVTSSSWFCASRVMFPLLRAKYNYATEYECFADRANHRAEWFNGIAAYNAGDSARLTREIFEEHDVYCGIRGREEFLAAKKEGLFDFAVWVQADARVGAGSETSDSITVTAADCDAVIDNNGSVAALRSQILPVLCAAQNSIEVCEPRAASPV